MSRPEHRIVDRLAEQGRLEDDPQSKEQAAGQLRRLMKQRTRFVLSRIFSQHVAGAV